MIQTPEHVDPGNFERVVSCVDKYSARKAVQYGKVPRTLLTAGTNDFLLTFSRHVLDDGLSCGLCGQAREKEPDCATASDANQEAFEAPIDPSIGFISVLTGILLGAELIKEVLPNTDLWRLRNTVRLQPLYRGVRVVAQTKDPNCNCSSPYVAVG